MRAGGDGLVDREQAGEEAALGEELYGLLPAEMQGR